MESVLIVPCRFRPAASMAVRSNEPHIEFPRRSLKTVAYERPIKHTTNRLENEGIETSVFKSSLLRQFVLCMWTSRRRKQLLERARNYDAVIVLGCEAAVQTVRNALESTNCQVSRGTTSEGIMSIQPRLSIPCNVSLEFEGVTP